MHPQIALRSFVEVVVSRPEYRPFRDSRSMPEDSTPKEQVSNHGRACTQVLSLSKAELGFFHFLEIATGWLVPSAGQKIPVQLGWYLPRRRSHLLKTSFFTQVREMKIQRKNPGSALHM
jgi:hypothetical protein